MSVAWQWARRVFEHGHGPREIPLLEDEMTESVLRLDRAMDIRGCLGNPGRFFAAGAPRGKLPQLSQAVHNQPRVPTDSVIVLKRW